MFLGKTVVHGTYVLCYLSRTQTGELASSVAVAEALDIPPEHARKILTALVDASLVASVRGRSGGYALAKRPDEISMLDVIDALHPRAGEAVLQARGCPIAADGACRTRRGLATLREGVREFFAGKTLASVVGEDCRGGDPAGLDDQPVGVFA